MRQWLSAGLAISGTAPAVVQAEVARTIFCFWVRS